MQKAFDSSDLDRSSFGFASLPERILLTTTEEKACSQGDTAKEVLAGI